MFSKNCRAKAQERVPCQYCRKTFSSGGRSIHERNCIQNPIVEERLRKVCSVCQIRVLGHVLIRSFAQVRITETGQAILTR
jgi:hypothetical protein